MTHDNAEAARRYRAKHPDRQRAASRRWAQANREKVRAYESARYDADPVYQQAKAARRRMPACGRESVPLALLRAIPRPTHCPVLGIPLDYGRQSRAGPKNQNKATIDRVDNAKGYTLDNVQFISWRANKLKSNATLAELEAIVAYMREHGADG